MFQRILVPVDLSEKSLTAVDAAYEFAAQSGAEVILLHVIETIEYVEFDDLKSFYQQLEAKARTRMTDICKRFVSKKLKVDQALVYGHRAQEIVDYANANAVDLIMMASHRIDSDRRSWSSISYAVAALADCPVLLVKPVASARRSKSRKTA